MDTDAGRETISRLEARISALEARLAQAEGALASGRGEHRRSVPSQGRQPPADDGGSPIDPQRPDRRTLLRVAGATAAGAVGGAVLSAPSPVAAADGDPINAGETNDATTSTLLSTDVPAGPGITGFGVIDRSLAAFPGTAGIAAHSNGRFANALFGYHEAVGNAVCGRADGPGANAVVGNAPDGYGATLSGGRSKLRLPPAGLAPNLRIDPHQQGELILDAEGNLWLCVESGIPGKWQLVSGPLHEGPLHTLDAPVRIYDSRPGEPPLSSPKGQWGVNDERDIDLSFGDFLPLNAISVLLNITVANTIGPGWLSLWKAGTPWPGTSTINWSGNGQVVANLTLIKLVATGVLLRKIRGRTVNVTDLIIDLVAYSVLTA